MKYLMLKILHFPLFQRISNRVMINRLYRILPFKMQTISYHFSKEEKNIVFLEEKLCQDIFDFYDKLVYRSRKGLGQQSGIWGNIENDQAILSEILSSKDSKKLAHYLNNAPTNAIARGILQGDLETNLLKRSKSYRNLAAKITRRRIESTLEAQGYKSILNPEQGQWKNISESELESMLRNFESNLDFRLSVPEIFTGLFEVSIGSNRFNQVDLMALNSALTVKKLMNTESLQKIVEIGGGSGRFTYYCTKLGLGPIHIIDLPHVLILQFWYLSKALPTSKVRFGNASDEPGSDIVLVLNTNASSIRSTQMEVVFNQDSFAEMPLDVVNEYLDFIATNKNTLIFSINHESRPYINYEGVQQINVFELLSTDSRFKLLSREMNWVRRGYVNSIFLVK